MLRFQGLYNSGGGLSFYMIAKKVKIELRGFDWNYLENKGPKKWQFNFSQILC